MAKIVARHPHVFARPERLDQGSRAPVGRAQADGALCKGEAAESSALPSGHLAQPAAALPALLQAYRLQQRAAAVGFDWREAEDVVPKIEEELLELHEAMRTRLPEGEDLVREELGDLLFAVVNLSRMPRIDPEQALRRASLKFRTRFNRMTELAAADGRSLGSLGLEQMDVYWNAVKAEGHRIKARAGRKEAPGTTIPVESPDAVRGHQTGYDLRAPAPCDAALLVARVTFRRCTIRPPLNLTASVPAARQHGRRTL